MATISGNSPTLYGSHNGNDQFVLSLSNTAVVGYGSNEAIRLDDATAAANVNLQTGMVTGWNTVQLTDIQQVYASPFGGTITAAADTNLIAAGSGNATIYAGSASASIYLGTGDNTVYAQSGPDTIYVGEFAGQVAGANVIDGGTGATLLSYQNISGPVTVDLSQGIGTHNGVQDQLTNVENVQGGAGANVLLGNNANNVIMGGPGDNYIDGRGGSDTLTGGGTQNTFVMDANVGADTITDFNIATDAIDISAFSSQFTSLASVLAASSQTTAGGVTSTTIQLSGTGSVTLDGVSMSSLTAADFHLAPPSTTVTGTSANDFTATFEGVVRQYTIGADGTTVTGGPENANDALVNINRIQFVDGYEAYSTSDPAAEVYRLYEATLNRAADPEGLAYWTNQLNSGTSLQTVANGFVTSPEFQADYGSLTNTQFVTQLYENVLHRAPDQAGLNYWVGDLNSGAMTEAQVVLGFTQSPEDISDLAGPVQQGLWVGNENAAEVARLYDTTLNRLPDVAGLAYWTNQLQTGTSLQTVVNGFVGSPEFQADYGALNNTQFVTQLYENTLHRAPDTAGLNYWVGELSSSAMTRAQVVLGFSDSPEHITDTAPHIDGGIWVV